MKANGILDGFPIHLLSNGDERSATLILDDTRLGRLCLQPAPGGRKTLLALSPDRGCLEATRRAMNRSGSTEILLVQADPRKLPFRRQAIHNVVALDSTAGEEPAELGRVLDRRGSWIELESPCRKEASAEHSRRPAQSRRYYVRPSSGRQYFVTREWVPRRWPFRSLQIGKLRALRIATDRVKSRLGLRRFCDSVGVVVHSRAGAQGVIDRWRGEEFGLMAKSGRGALLVGVNGEQPRATPIIVKFPLSGVSAGQLQNHIRALDELQTEVTAALREVIPQVVERGTVCGQAFHAETRCAGVTASNRWWIPGSRRRASRAGFPRLLELHCVTRRPTRVLPEVFDRLVLPRVAAVEETTTRLDPSFDLGPFVAALRSGLLGREVPLVRTHGDFCPENLLVSPRGTVTGLPDWEGSVKHGWPLLDLLHLIANQNKRRATTHFGSCVTGKLMRRRMARWEERMVREYCTRLQLEEPLWRPLVALYWLETVALYIRTDCDDGWLRRNVVARLPEILARLTGGLAS